MDIKQLSDDFQKSWLSIKSLLDQTQDQMKIQNEVLADLINTTKEQEQVIKQLIDDKF